MTALAAPRRRTAPALRLAPRTLVLRGPGTNCDRETELACARAGARVERVQVEALLDRPADLDRFALLVLPGGFSYGDHLGAGTLWAHRLEAIRAQLDRFVASGRPLIGICNGFQALLKLGLLEGGALAPNASGRFECRWVWLKNAAPGNPLLSGIDLLPAPVAHGEGRFVPTDESSLDRLRANHQVALVYCDQTGGQVTYPANPNGSAGALAGLLNRSGNVLGLMPHPERNIHPGDAPAGRTSGAGLRIFQNALAWARS